MHDIYLARQPIFDRELNVYGYELLFRPADTDHAGVIDGDQATSEVILNAFTVIGLDTLVGHRKAFINFTRGFFTNPHRLPLPPERVVLEVLEDIDPDEDFMESLRGWVAEGYQLSLDDFIWHERLRPLVELASLVKVEVSALSDEQIAEHVRQLRPYGVRLLAEKVETRECYELCHRLGFDYFQGYFLSRPRVMRGQSIASQRLPTLNLLAALHRPDVGLPELEELIARDVSLSYKLLRYLNSAFFSMPRRIDSIRDGVLYLGVQKLRTWATLLALSAMPGQSEELLTTLMIRARMCESLAQKLAREPASHYFTVGLLSGLDAVMDAPLEEILAALPLSDETLAALLHQQGPAGELLALTLAYERGDWEACRGAPLSEEQLLQAYLGAVAWSEQAKFD